MIGPAVESPPRAGAGARRRTWLRAAGLVLGLVLLLFAVGLADAWAALGSRPSGARLERATRSPQYRDGMFVDTIPRVEPDFWAVLMRWLRGTEHSAPSRAVPIVARSARDFGPASANGLRITWFGHSTLLVEMDGQRLLLDPVWGRRCSPSRFMGPERFHPPPLPLASLPAVDAVLISHDHYDHLDYPTIVELSARKNVQFVVPLGVGAHLEYWGIDASRIRELDWWQETMLGSLKLVATPARHFSGRGLGKDVTLWSGWAAIGPKHRVYYSGDTAMFEGFAQIGERFGPFDATMIEVGAYDAMWADVHLGPEQAVAAHREVRGGVLIPVHWGTFDLALHSWTEPAERVLRAARTAGVTVAIPRPGQSVDALAVPAVERWWPELPWKSAAQAPVVSSGLK